MVRSRGKWIELALAPGHPLFAEHTVHITHGESVMEGVSLLSIEIITCISLQPWLNSFRIIKIKQTLYVYVLHEFPWCYIMDITWKIYGDTPVTLYWPVTIYSPARPWMDGKFLMQNTYPTSCALTGVNLYFSDYNMHMRSHPKKSNSQPKIK